MCQSLWQKPRISPAKSGTPLKTLPWTDKFCHFVRLGGGLSQLLTGLAIRACSVDFTNLGDLMASGAVSHSIQRHLGPAKSSSLTHFVNLKGPSIRRVAGCCRSSKRVTLDDQSAIQQGSALWR